MRLNLALLAVAFIATALSVAPSFAEEAAPAKCPVTKSADGKVVCDYAKKAEHRHAVDADGKMACDPANCPVEKCPVPMTGDAKSGDAALCDPANCPLKGAHKHGCLTDKEKAPETNAAPATPAPVTP
ncbi:MAG: hypothetical protein HQK87_04670 [Nitrospinae bacterium]|nr:hypothetical protein [Nitrospinota bacterium]